MPCEGSVHAQTGRRRRRRWPRECTTHTRHAWFSHHYPTRRICTTSTAITHLHRTWRSGGNRRHRPTNKPVVNCHVNCICSPHAGEAPRQTSHLPKSRADLALVPGPGKHGHVAKTALCTATARPLAREQPRWMPRTRARRRSVPEEPWLRQSRPVVYMQAGRAGRRTRAHTCVQACRMRAGCRCRQRQAWSAHRPSPIVTTHGTMASPNMHSGNSPWLRQGHTALALR